MAKITGLEARAEAAFKAELAELKNSVTGTMTELQTSLSTATTNLTNLTTALKTALTGARLEVKSDASAGEMVNQLSGRITALETNLTNANSELTTARTALLDHLAALPGHGDYKKDGPKAGATLKELITAEQNATNAAIAASGVKLENLPAGGKQPAAAATGQPKNLTEACLAANKKK